MRLTSKQRIFEANSKKSSTSEYISTRLELSEFLFMSND